MRFDATFIANVAETVREMLGEDFDAETFWDTLDGETDAADLIDRFIRMDIDARAAVEAQKAAEKLIADRRRRFEARSEAARKAFHTILSATGEKNVERPLATISLRQGSMSVEITDDSAIPTQLRRPGTPDKTAIKKALEAGETIPGAALTRGSDGVTVRYQ